MVISLSLSFARAKHADPFSLLINKIGMQTIQ
jgi:hypothetical protein